MTLKLAHILTLLSQLPSTRPIWHSSTQLGLPDLICACHPLGLRLLVQEILSTVSLQIVELDSWNVTEAEAAGGARHFDSVHTCIFLMSFR